MPPSAPVRFRSDAGHSLPPLEQVRHQLLAYMHLGLLPAGSRLPAVRDLAQGMDINLKTAFRIYRSLAGDGLVEIVPQKGVFVKSSERASGRAYRAGIESFVERILREAKRYNLAPARISQLLASRSGGSSQAPVRCAFLECNREQTGVFSAELRRRLGLEVAPVLTTGPRTARERDLRQADVFITTYYHRDQVSMWSARHHKEVFCIRLNPEFIRMLGRNGRKGLFPMIMSADVGYEPRFRRVMSRLLPAKVLERIELVQYQDVPRVNELLKRARRAYVSPLVFDEVRRHTPPEVELITLREMISRQSIDELRRNLVSPNGKPNHRGLGGLRLLRKRLSAA